MEGSFKFTDSSLKTNINTVRNIWHLLNLYIYCTREYFSKYNLITKLLTTALFSLCPKSVKGWVGTMERAKARQTLGANMLGLKGILSEDPGLRTEVNTDNSRLLLQIQYYL